VRRSLSRAALGDADRRLTSKLQSVTLSTVMRVGLSLAAHSGDWLVLIPLFVLWWAVDHFSPVSPAIPFGLGFVASTGLTAIFKLAFRRKRPPGEWGALDRKTDPHSFPSGHASRAATLSIVAFALGQPLAGLPLLVWAAAVGFSRVVFGMHYVFDVVAGFVIGIVAGLGIWYWMALGFPW
jgi:undecaprenyl-diphosphatase